MRDIVAPIGISRVLTERALAKLGFSAAPAANRDGLAAVYAARRRSVPEDFAAASSGESRGRGEQRDLIARFDK